MIRSTSILALVGLCLPLAGCTTSGPPEPDTSLSSVPEASAPVDPYLDLSSDPEQRSTLEGVTPLLRSAGTGPTTFALTDVPADTVEIRYFVSCSPESEFTLTTRLWFSGPCGIHWANSGSIPLAGSGPVSVDLDLPQEVRFRIVALPIPNEKALQ